MNSIAQEMELGWSRSGTPAQLEQCCHGTGALIPTWRTGSGGATAPQLPRLPQGFKCQIRVEIVLG